MTLKAYYVTTQDRDEGDCKNVFAKSKKAARKAYAAEMGMDATDPYIEVTRKKAYDVYAEVGRVPLKVLLHDGWWHECFHCSQRLSFDDDDIFARDDAEIKEVAEHNVGVEFDLVDFDIAMKLPPRATPGSQLFDLELQRREPREQAYYRGAIAAREIDPPLDAAAMRFEGTDRVFCNISCQYEHHVSVTRINTTADRALVKMQTRFPDGVDWQVTRYPYLHAQVTFRLPDHGFQYPLTYRAETDELSHCLGDADAWVRYAALHDQGICP